MNSQCDIKKESLIFLNNTGKFGNDELGYPTAITLN